MTKFCGAYGYHNSERLQRCCYLGGDLPLGWKGLSLGHPILRGSKILAVRTVSSISVSNYMCIFVLLQCMFSYYAASRRSP